jgi:hypothetical protein
MTTGETKSGRVVSSDPKQRMPVAVRALRDSHPSVTSGSRLWEVIAVVSILAACDSKGTGPANTNALTSVILNRGQDSAIVVLEDATGAVMRSQTIPAKDSACWTTALSDSVWYNVGVWVGNGIYFPFANGSLNGAWVSHVALQQTHEWIVTVDTLNGAPIASVGGVTPAHTC